MERSSTKQLLDQDWRKTRKKREKPLPVPLSEHDWEPVLDRDYSWLFEKNCQNYSHYLDIVTQQGYCSIV